MGDLVLVTSTQVRKLSAYRRGQPEIPEMSDSNFFSAEEPWRTLQKEVLNYSHYKNDSRGLDC